MKSKREKVSFACIWATRMFEFSSSLISLSVIPESSVGDAYSFYSSMLSHGGSCFVVVGCSRFLRISYVGLPPQSTFISFAYSWTSCCIGCSYWLKGLFIGFLYSFRSYMINDSILSCFFWKLRWSLALAAALRKSPSLMRGEELKSHD